MGLCVRERQREREREREKRKKMNVCSRGRNYLYWSRGEPICKLEIKNSPSEDRTRQIPLNQYPHHRDLSREERN